MFDAARAAEALADEVRALQAEWAARAGNPRRHPAAAALIAALPAVPVVDLRAARAVTGSSAKATLQGIDRLAEAGVLRERTGRRRARVWESVGLFALLDGIEERVGASPRRRRGAHRRRLRGFSRECVPVRSPRDAREARGPTMRTTVGAVLTAGALAAMAVPAMPAARVQLASSQTVLEVSVVSETTRDHAMIIEPFGDDGRLGWRVRQPSLGQPAFGSQDPDCTVNPILNDVVCDTGEGRAGIWLETQTVYVLFGPGDQGRHHEPLRGPLRCLGGPVPGGRRPGRGG